MRRKKCKRARWWNSFEWNGARTREEKAAAGEPPEIDVWLDDLRRPPHAGWYWVETAEGAITLLRYARVRTLSLDHDLGEDRTSRPVVLWLIQSGRWPTNVLVHSRNPVGAAWLREMVERYR